MWVRADVRYQETIDVECEVLYDEETPFTSFGPRVTNDMIQIRRPSPAYSPNRHFYTFIPLLEVQEIAEKDHRP